MPRLVLHLLDGLPAASRPALARALDRKDAAEVAELGGSIAGLLLQLLEATGTAERAIPALLAIDLPESARLQAIRMGETVAAIRRQRPDLPLTADPVEFRGYQYHTLSLIHIYPATMDGRSSLQKR